MKLSSDSFQDGQRIPEEFAMGKHHVDSHAEFAANRSPHLAWQDVPEGTRSLAVICCDPDVPSVGDDVNQEGRTVSRDLPRVDFYHWVLVDLPANTRELEPGEFCDGVVQGGKDAAAPRGARRGLNNYTQWFEGDAEMSGDYFGYDGPFPPWNDELLHRYVFTVYALDFETAAVDGSFSGPDALAAMQGHVLAQASITGTYAVNPDAA